MAKSMCKDVSCERKFGEESLPRGAYTWVDFNILLNVTRIFKQCFTVRVYMDMYFTKTTKSRGANLPPEWECPEFIDRRDINIDHWTWRRVVHTFGVTETCPPETRKQERILTCNLTRAKEVK